MKIAVFNTKSYDKQFLTKANAGHGHDLTFFEVHLNTNTCKLAYGFEAVCAFVNDDLNQEVLKLLANEGVRLIVLRSAGFNNVDVQAASALGIAIARVPAYSPHGVAEHAVALMLALNRKIYRTYNRIREANFSLEGLLGFEMYGKTAGVVGTGQIGILTARILKGFGCRVLAYDVIHNPLAKEYGIEYVGLDQIYAQSDIITLHVPLMPSTRHMIDANAVSKMKKGVMLINTSRGALVDTQSVINGLKSGKIGYLGLDVYEEEGDLFFEDLSGQVIQDDIFMRLITFPNVVITGHQAFFTDTALKNIAQTTLQNVTDFASGKLNPANVVDIKLVK